ncbi:hypothetical protein C2W62_41480 [Candidatus Entotheonella serta]|nr:hypothetical protein C2W62_41480 [Candidatus Entotheonella serta]
MLQSGLFHRRRNPHPPRHPSGLQRSIGALVPALSLGFRYRLIGRVQFVDGILPVAADGHHGLGVFKRVRASPSA